MNKLIVFVVLILTLASLSLSLSADTDSFSGYLLNNQTIGNIVSDGKYYSFDGVNDYIIVPYSNVFQTGTGGFTVGMVCELEHSDDIAIFRKGNGKSGGGWLLAMDGTGTATFKVFSVSVSANISITMNRRLCIIGTFINGKLVLYVNGIKVNEVTASGDINDTNDIYIGRGVSTYETGLVSSVYFIDIGSSDSDIKYLYSGKPSKATYLLRLLPDNAGSFTWMDAGEYGINGEVKGATLHNDKIGDTSTIYIKTTSASITLTDALSPGYIIVDIVAKTRENITNFTVAKEGLGSSQFILSNQTLNAKTIVFTQLLNYELIDTPAYIHLTLTGNDIKGVEVWIQTKKVY